MKSVKYLGTTYTSRQVFRLIEVLGRYGWTVTIQYSQRYNPPGWYVTVERYHPCRRTLQEHGASAWDALSKSVTGLRPEYRERVVCRDPQS